MIADSLIDVLLTILSVAGVVALVIRITRSAGRVLLAFAGIAAARSGGDASARRGDVTGMREGKIAERRARLALSRAAATGVAWLSWLVAPIPLGVMTAAYSAAAVLWILPPPRVAPADHPTAGPA